MPIAVHISPKQCTREDYERCTDPVHRHTD
jgi:hypothetical protein